MVVVISRKVWPLRSIIAIVQLTDCQKEASCSVLLGLDRALWLSQSKSSWMGFSSPHFTRTIAHLIESKPSIIANNDLGDHVTSSEVIMVLSSVSSKVVPFLGLRANGLISPPAVKLRRWTSSPNWTGEYKALVFFSQYIRAIVASAPSTCTTGNSRSSPPN